MNLEILFSILNLLAITAFSFFKGYGDGYFKDKDTAFHWSGAFVFGAGLMFLISGAMKYVSFWNVISLVLCYMPLHDFGYARGNSKLKELFAIGETDWTGILFHKTGLWRLQYETKFPAIYILYAFMWFAGTVLNIHGYILTTK